MSQDIDTADLDQLVALIRAADPDRVRVRSVSLDPSQVTLPGVWVSVEGFGPHRLDGNTIRTRVHLIVEDGDIARTVARLAELYNVVVPALPGPTLDTASRVGVILPGSTTPMPALAVPFDLLTH